jgi:hypothetical protein
MQIASVKYTLYDEHTQKKSIKDEKYKHPGDLAINSSRVSKVVHTDKAVSHLSLEKSDSDYYEISHVWTTPPS